jgi:hypothetical protein
MNDNYEIQYSTDGTNWQPALPISTQGDIEKAEITVPTSHIKYYFRVRAAKASYYSEWLQSDPTNPETWDYAIPIWSDEEKALAYNNSQNIGIDSDGTICVGKNLITI